MKHHQFTKIVNCKRRERERERERERRESEERCCRRVVVDVGSV
jgi:hypothetical protein